MKALEILVTLFALAGTAAGQSTLVFKSIERSSSAEVVLRMTAPAQTVYRIDHSADLKWWEPLVTLRSAGSDQHTDSSVAPPDVRFYRAMPTDGANVLTGDHLITNDGEVVFHPINHATLVMSWKGKMIYNDPVGGATAFQGLPRADLILISHSHGDHFNSSTVDAVKGPNAVIIAPQAVYNGLSAATRNQTIVLANGKSTNVLGILIEAVPAYNLTTSNHAKGAGNGYVITIGGRRLYFSGDTEDIPEMRQLQNIDVAFVCMNVPFTMSVAKAASAVRDFRPKVIYPYHFRNQDQTFADLSAFKRQVGTDVGVEVRTRKWY